MSEQVTRVLSGTINGGLGATNQAFNNTNFLAANPYGFMGKNQGKEAPVRIEPGEVVFSYGYSGIHDVRLAGQPTMTCFVLQDSTCGPLGVQTNTLLLPGTKVWVLVLPASDGNQKSKGFGLILGSMPVLPGRLDIPHFRIPAFQGGPFGDSLHKFQWQSQMLNNILSYGCGRLVDLVGGEWGKNGTFGTFLTVEHFAASLGVSPTCGIFAYYFNNMLRLAGSLMRQETDTTEKWEGLIERESTILDYGSLYPWEALGAPDFDVDPIIDESSNTANGQNRLPLEPAEGGLQRAIWRDVRMGGYLGDVYHRFVSTPLGLTTVHKRGSNRQAFAGLFMEHIGSDGSYAVASAKEIHLRKTLMIPAVLPEYDPLDPEGDSEGKTYKPSGINEEEGKTDDTSFKKRYDWNSDKQQVGMMKVCRMADFHAYMFFKYYVQSVNLHANDFYLQNASDGALVNQTTLFQPVVSTKSWVIPPEPVRVKVDHRTDKAENNVEYYRTEAGVHLLEDGGIMLSDGYGSEIVLSGGNITVSCPGDVWLRPGRSLIAWSPRDTVLRAGNSVDITAAKRDVRIKAEKNLLMLANTGGALIESRGTAQVPDKSKSGEEQTLSGVMIKATRSTAQVTGQDIYLKALSGGVAGRAGITLDSGMKDILLIHKALRTVGSNVQMALGQNRVIGEDGSIPNTKLYSLDGNIAYLPGMLIVEKNLATGKEGAYIGGQLVVENNIMGKSGMSLHGSIGSASQFAGPIDSKAKEAIRTAVNGLATSINAQKTSLGGDGVDNIATEQITPELQEALGEEKPGNEDYLKGFGFSFRKPSEYLTDPSTNEFKLWESKWQSVAEKTWDEPSIKGPDPDGTLEGMPHPGKEPWEGNTLQKFTPVNVTGDLPKNKNEISAVPAAVEAKTLKSDYKVSLQELS